jgi:DNA-binding CsgD family transcriptional regulator
LSQFQFRRLGLYREFFQHFGVDEHIVVRAPGPQSLLTGIAINRRRRPFTERERELLNLLRPHLYQAYRLSELTEQLHEKRRQLDRVMDGAGIHTLVVDDQARVVDAKSSTLADLATLFTNIGRAADWLPPQVRAWFHEQRRIVAREVGPIAAPPSPYVLRHSGGRVVLRLMPDSSPSRFVLVLQLQPVNRGAAALLPLGLSIREAQVLFGVAQGLSNPDIGARLRISSRTVQKHLEHVFDKLGVRTRTEAAVRAEEQFRAGGAGPA